MKFLLRTGAETGNFVSTMKWRDPIQKWGIIRLLIFYGCFWQGHKSKTFKTPEAKINKNKYCCKWLSGWGQHGVLLSRSVQKCSLVEECMVAVEANTVQATTIPPAEVNTVHNGVVVWGLGLDLEEPVRIPAQPWSLQSNPELLGHREVLPLHPGTDGQPLGSPWEKGMFVSFPQEYPADRNGALWLTASYLVSNDSSSPVLGCTDFCQG